MSKTYAYANIAALFATFTITPALAALLFREDTEEHDTFLVRALRLAYRRSSGAGMRDHAATILVAGLLMVGAGNIFTRLGAEFLPTREEGGLWGASESFLNIGTGSHSNHLRGAAISVEAADPQRRLSPMPPLVRAKRGEIGFKTARMREFVG
jgi:Cu/Ag efflux pump CusA